VPGYRGEIRLNRDDLEDAIRQPLDSFIGFFHDVLQLNGIRLEGLAAVASVGGGASIPFVTRTLSEQSGALVISAPRPHLTAAVGAALRAARGPGDAVTALAPTALGSMSDATSIAEMPVEPAATPALAWSEAGDDSGIVPIRAGEYDGEYDKEPRSELTSSRLRPRAQVEAAAEPDVIGAYADPWYRRPLVVAVGTALAVLAIGAGVLITLRHTSGNAPSTPSPSVSKTAPPSPETTAGQQPSASPPSSSAPDTSTPAPTTSETPGTTTTTEAPTTTTTPPATTTEPQRPDRPRFPRRPGDRFFDPGQGGR